jgi:hypothetical protein
MRENFDGHVAAKTGITSAINLSHPSLAKQGDDLVRPDARAGSDHGRAVYIIHDRRRGESSQTFG